MRHRARRMSRHMICWAFGKVSHATTRIARLRKIEIGIVPVPLVRDGPLDNPRAEVRFTGRCQMDASLHRRGWPCESPNIRHI